EVRDAGRRAVFGRRPRLRRDADALRGRPYRHGVGRPAGRRSEALQRRRREAGGLSATVLGVDGISLAFRGVKALQHVSFDVRQGEIRAIIGPNGAGKSSMLNVINGVYRPQAGTITYKGETRRHFEPHEAARLGIARTFQNIALFRGMTVLEN